MNDKKRIAQLEKAILNAVDKVPSWADNYETYCQFCVAAPSVGHFAHCITKTINEKQYDKHTINSNANSNI